MQAASQSGPLGGSTYSLPPATLPFSTIHQALLSYSEFQKQYQALDVDVCSTATEHNNNDLLSVPNLTSSSSRSDSDSAASPPSIRENVIVRHDSRRKKEQVKDSAYWERRRKNNDAAKRSRDTRRIKEDEMATKAASLEKDNLRLRGELDQLRQETDQLRTLLLTSSSIIKAPIALRRVPSFPVSLIAAPSVITANETYSAQLRAPFPDSTHRNTVLVSNFVPST